MWDYAEWIRSRIPRPTRHQNYAWAEEMSDSHSWEKHLPLTPPGEPFILYLDPNADRRLVQRVDGARAQWRDFVPIDASSRRSGLKLDLRPGDVGYSPDGPPTRYLKQRLSTAESANKWSAWSYWNFGPPGQRPADAITNAHRRIEVKDDDGDGHRVPEELLRLGLVYLHGTIAPVMSLIGCSPGSEYEELRLREGMPSAADDRRTQLRNLASAMKEVADAIFGPAV